MEFLLGFLEKDSIAIGLLAVVFIMIIRGDLVPRKILLERDKFIDRVLAANEVLIEGNKKALGTAGTTEKLLTTINKEVGGVESGDNGDNYEAHESP